MLDTGSLQIFANPCNVLNWPGGERDLADGGHEIDLLVELLQLLPDGGQLLRVGRQVVAVPPPRLATAISNNISYNVVLSMFSQNRIIFPVFGIRVLLSGSDFFPSDPRKIWIKQKTDGPESFKSVSGSAKKPRSIPIRKTQFFVSYFTLEEYRY